MSINNIDNLTFRSGLNTSIKINEKLTNTHKVEERFYNRYGVEACFVQNKSTALANNFCAEIFERLTKIFKQKLILPPCITVFNRKYLIDKNSASNFCISDTKEVLQGEYPYPGRSIFFQDIKSLSEIDEITEYQYQNKYTSSSHFLAPFIHEWLHSIQLDKIYRKFGYGGSCNYLNKIYPTSNTIETGYQILQKFETKTLTPKENEIIFEQLGDYATKPQNQYFEIFAETFTKLICDSLNGTKIIKNPLDALKEMPLEFQKILKKVITLQNS